MLIDSEIHVFIIWEKGLYKQQEIESQLVDSFELLDVYRVNWPKEKFANELSRFYGENLPPNSHKERHCGSGPFMCYVIKDGSPKYDLRQTSKGLRLVNINIFDKKTLFRQITNHGHLIHASDNLIESKTQLYILTGRSHESYRESIKASPILKETTGFCVESIRDLFDALNATQNYVVLRNYESLDGGLLEEHPDIDLLTDDQSSLVRVVGAKKRFKNSDSVQYHLSISGKDVSLDVRHIGDGYYCDHWQRKILLTRKLENNIYIPDAREAFFSLLYHALLHKRQLSNDYLRRIQKLALLLKLEEFQIRWTERDLLIYLMRYMDSNNYKLVEPKDLGVFWNDLLIKSYLDFDTSSVRLARLHKTALLRKFRYKFKKLLGLNVEKYKKN